MPFVRAASRPCPHVGSGSRADADPIPHTQGEPAAEDMSPEVPLSVPGSFRGCTSALAPESSPSGCVDDTTVVSDQCTSTKIRRYVNPSVLVSGSRPVYDSRSRAGQRLGWNGGVMRQHVVMAPQLGMMRGSEKKNGERMVPVPRSLVEMFMEHGHVMITMGPVVWQEAVPSPVDSTCI